MATDDELQALLPSAQATRAPTQTRSNDDELTALLPKNGEQYQPSIPEPPHTFGEETAGAFAYGAANTGQALTSLMHLTEMSRSLEMFKKDNPQYAPERVDHAYELLTSPGKLVSNVSAGGAQLLGTVGAMSIPYIGIPLAAGLNGTIEYENTKEDALQRGVNPRDAEMAAWSSGVVSAAIQLIPETQMFRYVTGGEKAVAKSLYASTLKEALASELPQEAAMAVARKQMGEYLGKEISPVLAAEMMKSAPGISGAIARKLSFGSQGVEDALSPILAMGGYGAVGGAATESIKRQFYGKDIKEPLPDFNWGSWLDSRAQEFLTGAGTAAFVGVPLHMVSQKIAENKLSGHLPDFTAIKDDLISKDQFYDSFLNKMSPEQRSIAEPMFDRIWQTAAEANGMTTREKALKTWMTLSKQGENVDVGPLAQTDNTLAGTFTKAKIAVESPEFEQIVGKGKSSSDMLKILENPENGFSANDLKWLGIRDWLSKSEEAVTIEKIKSFVNKRIEDVPLGNRVEVQEPYTQNPTNLKVMWPNESHDIISAELASGDMSLGILKLNAGTEEQQNFLIKQSALYAAERGYNTIAVPNEEIANKTLSLLKTLDSEAQVVDGKITLTQPIQEGLILGQPLAQKESLKSLLDRIESGKGPYLTMAPPDALLKAAMDKFGGIHTGDFQDHSQILQAAWSKEGLMPRDFQSVGYLTKGENEGLQYVPKREGLELYLARTLRDDTVPVGSKDVVLHSPTEYLAQGINGSTTFLRQANGLVKALVSMNDPANFSTAFHELAHVLTYFSSPDERAALEKFVKRDYDHWGTAEWEKVAKSFEAYVQKGSSPSPALQPFFEAASEHMVKVYGALRDSTLAKQLSPEALQAFDNWVVKDTPEIAQARVRQATMDAAYTQIEDIKHLAYRSPVYAQLLEQAEGNIKNAQIQLQAERVSRLSREPEVSKRADLNHIIEEARSSATPASLGMARVLEKFAFSALTPFSLERSLGTNAYALKHVELANAALARMNMISQPLKAEAEDTLSSVHPKVFKELEQLDPVSEHALISKGTRLLDRSSQFATPIEPGSAHEVVAQAFYKARYTLLKMMEDVGGWRLFSGGAREPVKAGEYDINNLRKNRIFDRDFRDRWQVDAEFQKSVVAAYSEVNPEMNAKDIFSFMDGLVHNTDIRKSSSLEFGRTFPNAPDAVMHDGKIVPVLEIGVRDLLARSINSEASRIAVIEKYGQSGLEKANISHWSRFAHILDLDQSFTADMLRSRLNEATGDDGSSRVDPTVTQGMNYSQLRKLAKTLEIPAGLTQEDFVRMTDKVRAADLLNVDASINQVKQKQLTKLAKELGGITLQQPFADLLNEVKLRLKELPVDVYDQLKKGYADTGGQNVKGFEELWQRMQGINPSGPQSPWMKVMNAIKAPIGILHMFGQAPLWVTQISNYLPKAGLINFLGGVQDFFRNPELTRAQATALGTLASAGESLKREYGVNSLGRWMSEKVYALSGMSRVDDFISLVGTNIGIRLAESWNNNGMQTKDIGLAKALRLSEADMQMLREHKMTDELKGKIAQNFVDRGGGFYNASGVKRGALENTPLGRLFFSYGTYANSMARYGMDFMTEARSAAQFLKKGDVKPALQAGYKLALLTGTIVGMYGLGKVLRGALTGTLNKQPDETLGEKGLHAILDFGILGPAQRLMTGMMYDGGDTSKVLTAMSPQLVAIGDMFASLLNNKYMPQGRYANYDWWDRLWMTARDNVPFAGAMKNFYEQALFPDKAVYDKTRAEVTAYSKRHNLALGIAKADQGFSFENPYTHNLVTAMERMDFEGAKDLVQKYYDVEIPRLSQDEWIKDGLTYETMQEKLRSTLLAHSPLREVDGNPYMLSDFLSKHDKDFAGTMLVTDAKYKAMVNAFAPSQKH